MATRPTVGGSANTWGTELNAHLAISLAADGKINDGAAQSTSAAPTADAEVANKKYVDDQADAHITEAGTWQHDGTQVYDANAPTTYTDLNLSAYVGSNYALVFLKVKNGTGLAKGYFFRTNGDTENVGINATTSAGGPTIMKINGGHIGYFILETSSGGVIEWKCESAADTDIWIRGYVK